MGRPLLFVLAVAMTTALLAQSAAPVAHACTCGAFSGDYAAYRAHIVVVGTVSEHRLGPARDSGSDCGEYRNEEGAISVERYLKGTGTPQISFYSVVGFCSGPVQTDRRLLIFLSGDGSLETEPVDLCGNCKDNAELAMVEQALRLAPGTLYSGVDADGGNTILLLIVGSAVITVLAVLITVALIRRRGWP